MPLVAIATPAVVESAALDADVVVGAVFVPATPTPKLLPRALVARMKRGAVIVDVSIDAGGVGQLVEIGVEKGRKVKPDLKIGVCGEHGGDPSSIHFFHKIGLDYVSCSPYRVPIARLAAAQAQLEKPVGD